MDNNTFITAIQYMENKEKIQITNIVSEIQYIYVVKSVSTQLLTFISTNRDPRKEVDHISKRYNDNHIIYGKYIQNVTKVMNIMSILLSDNKIERQYKETWYSLVDIHYALKLLSDTDDYITNYQFQNTKNIVARSGGYINNDVEH